MQTAPPSVATNSTRRRIDPRPPLDVQGFLDSLVSLPACDIRPRIDYLCGFCGETVATMNTAGKPLLRMIRGRRLNCPKCGERQCCDQIAYADPAIRAVAEWYIRGGVAVLRMIELPENRP